MGFYEILQNAFYKNDFSFLKDKSKIFNIKILLSFQYIENIIKNKDVKNINEFQKHVNQDVEETDSKKYFLELFKPEYEFYQ